MLKSLRLIAGVLGILFFFSCLSTTGAAELLLTDIGALPTNGQKYTEWWYTGTNPVLKGTGAASQDLTINIDSQIHTVTTNTEGVWFYQATLAQGDYNLNISQGSISYTFTLHLGQALPSTITSQTTQSTNSVPATGYNQIAAIGFGLGIALLASYLYINDGSQSKKVFEQRMLRED